MGSPAEGPGDHEDLQHRLSRRAVEGFCDLQDSGGRSTVVTTFAQGLPRGRKRDATDGHEDVGTRDQLRRRGMGTSLPRLA